MDRILIAFKAISHEIRHRLHPSEISRVRMSGQHLSDGSVKAVMMYIVTYFLLTFLSIIIVMLCGETATEAVSGVIASIGTVGPGLGELGSMDNYSSQAAVSKFVYTVDMFLGRVEIYPILVVMAMMFRRGK